MVRLKPDQPDRLLRLCRLSIIIYYDIFITEKKYLRKYGNCAFMQGYTVVHLIYRMFLIIRTPFPFYSPSMRWRVYIGTLILTLT